MSVDLVPEWTIGDLCLTSYPFGVDADSTVDIGEPEMVVEGVTSNLADGDIERVVRHGNRTYVIPLYVMGATLGELAEAEAVLRAEIKKTGLALTHDPGDGFTPASVYEVSTAALTPERDDTRESHLIRRYVLSLTCLPFARSVEMVTVDALEVGAGAEVVLETCDSATGWEAFVNAVPIGPPDPAFMGTSGTVWVVDFNPGPQTLVLRRALTFSVVDRPYIRVNVRASEPAQTSAIATVDGSDRSLVLVSHRKLLDTADTHEFVFAVPPGSSTVTSLTIGNYSYASNATFGVSEVAHRGKPSAYTRQSTRVIIPGGTERTPAAISVTAPDGVSDLFTTIVHTSPEDGTGYSPPLRRWRVSGNSVSVDPSALSGAWEPLTPNPFTADVPVRAVPSGGYVVAARVYSSVTGTVTLSWATTTIIPGYPGAMPSDGGERHFDLVANVPTYVSLGITTLPTLRTLADNASVRVIVGHAGGGGTVNIDEAWIFRAGDDCALTVVDGIYRSRLWLNSPDVDSPVPKVMFGDAEDGSDAIHPGALLRAHGSHVLNGSGGTAVFTATQGVTYPATSATFYRRWHSNAAD